MRFMKLSINILTWNTFPTLHDTLHILADELKGIESEIIIVDNGSTDGCQDIATIKNEKNMGISRGKNQGVDASTGEYIFLLDGDIVPVPNSIILMLRHLEENPDCHAIGFRPNKFSNQKNRNGQAHHEGFCKELYQVREHRGHCIYYGMYRRMEVFGPGKVRFDENYPSGLNGVGYGWEDLDSYMQMDKLGIKQYVADVNHAGGKYYHEINSSIRQMGYQEYMRTSLKRGIYFKGKWGSTNAIQPVA